MPRISVIMPAYNAEGFLQKSVASVVDQTFGDWELIIVDDGSTDATAQICDELARSDERINVLHTSNGGVSSARNAGMALAAGDYIAFLDSDDWLEPQAYEKMLSLTDSMATTTVACGNRLAYPDGSSAVEAPPLGAGLYLSDETQIGIVIPLLCDRLRPDPLNGYIWRYLFSRETIVSGRITFYGAYLEDELFLIEYFSTGATLAVTDEPLYNYYQNPASVTSRYLPTYIETFAASLAAKERLIAKYEIPVLPAWRHNTCWAGLLIAVANEFAPGNPASFAEKRKRIRFYREGVFAAAVEGYVPGHLPRNKAVVAALIRRRMYTLLSTMYIIKNRNRGN